MAMKLGELEVTIGADTSKLERAEGVVPRTGDGMSKTFKRVGFAIAAAVTLDAARRILLAADNFSVLERRLVRFTGSAQRAALTMSALTKTASATGAEIKDTVAIFERFSLVRKDIGATNEQVLQLTDTVSKLGALGGSSQDEISNALRQMTQAFSGGIVRAEEFNSILENTPEVARVIAREMDMTMGQVRQAMLAGQLTAKQVFDAMISASEQTNAEFEKMPKSIVMTAQALTNELLVAVAAVDKQLDFTATIARSIAALGDLVGESNKLNEMQRLIEMQTKPGAALPEITPAVIAAREMDALITRRVNLEEHLAGMSQRDTKLAKERRDYVREQLAAVQDSIAALRDTRSASIVADRREGEGPMMASNADEAPAAAPISGPDETKLAKLRQLNETERDEIGRMADERRAYVLGLAGLQAGEELTLLAEIETARLSALQTVSDNEAAQTARLAADATRDMKLLAVSRLMQLNETELETIARIAEERRAFIATLDTLGADERASLLAEIEEKRLADLQASKDRELEIEQRAADKAQDIADRAGVASARAKKAESDALIGNVNQTSNAVSNILQATGRSSAASFAAVLSGVASMATTIVGIMAAQAQAQAAADPSAVTVFQKIANVAMISSQFVGITAALTSAKGGGRQFGGGVSPMQAHPVNEGGVPELLEQGGRQYLMPNGKGGKVTPIGSGAGATAQAKITIISNGTPQTVTGSQVTAGEVRVMIDDAAKQTERRINGSLATGRGDTARSMQSGFKVERNLR